MRKIGFGVIGTGFWGRNHARVLSELGNARLVAVCDVDVNKAEAIGKKYDSSWCSDVEELLKMKDLEAVCICTPTTTHAEIALKAIHSGKHVLIEKPMANTVTQAKNILNQGKGGNVLIMVGFIERFNPALQRLKEIIKNGDLGEVVLAFARRVGKWPERIGDVGVVKDSSIHDVDLMRFLFEEEPLSVYARAGSLGHQFEDYAQIMLSFSGIKTGFAEANWLTPHKVRTLTVTGQDAIASMDFITQELIIEDVDKETKLRPEWQEPLKLELEHFAECVIKNREPAVTGLDGLRALQICDAALDASKMGKVIKIHF
ncbi:MAG: Gfo/Idh/MocA family oxidoreductase [Candidatus Bathyarchaeota archaeon]